MRSVIDFVNKKILSKKNIAASKIQARWKIKQEIIFNKKVKSSIRIQKMWKRIIRVRSTLDFINLKILVKKKNQAAKVIQKQFRVM